MIVRRVKTLIRMRAKAGYNIEPMRLLLGMKNIKIIIKFFLTRNNFEFNSLNNFDLYLTK